MKIVPRGTYKFKRLKQERNEPVLVFLYFYKKNKLS